MYRKVKNYIDNTLSGKRLEHSMSTALLCVDLCGRFGLDEQKGRIAGYAHDAARDIIITSEMIDGLDDNYPVTEVEKEYPVLIHGRYGAKILKEELDIDDEEILQAIRWHTAGHPEMGKLGQVLFVADYIEAGRMHVTREYRESILKLSLNEMTLKVLTDQTSYIRDKGYPIAGTSIELYDMLSNAKKILKV